MTVDDTIARTLESSLRLNRLLPFASSIEDGELDFN